MKAKNVKGILHGLVSDFAENVAPIYKLLDWRWHYEDVPPTQGEIEQTLMELIDHFDYDSCSTGGLEVFFNKEDSEIGIRFEYCKSVLF